MNSLYDSLASELEASDSGFYTTPMVSARSDYPQPNHSNFAPLSLQQELEKIREQDEDFTFDLPCTSSQLEDVERIERDCQTTPRVASATSEGSSDECGFYDMPSKAIMTAVRRSMSAEKRRRKSPAIQQSSSLDSDESERRYKPMNLQLCTHPPIGYLETVQEHVQTPTVEKEEKDLAEVLKVEPGSVEKMETLEKEMKEFREVSCSPIHFDEIEEACPGKNIFFVN